MHNKTIKYSENSKKIFTLSIILIFLFLIIQIHADTHITDPNANQEKKEVKADNEQAKVTSQEDGKKKADFTGTGGSVTDDKGNQFTGIKPQTDGKKAEIIFDKNNNVASADFKTEAGKQEQKYTFGNDEFKVPPNSQVEKKDGSDRISIKMPDGSLVSEPPERTAKNKEREGTQPNIVTYEGKDIKIKTEISKAIWNGENVKIEKSTKEIKYSGSLNYQWDEKTEKWLQFVDKEQDFSTQGVSTTTKADAQKSITETGKEKNDRTYIGFDEGVGVPNMPQEGGSWISYGEKTLAGGSTNNKASSLITLGKDNPYVPIDPNTDKFSLKPSANSDFSLSNRQAENQVALFQTRGNINVNIGNKEYAIDGKQLYMNPFAEGNAKSPAFNWQASDTNYNSLLPTKQGEATQQWVFNRDNQYRSLPVGQNPQDFSSSFSYNYPAPQNQVPLAAQPQSPSVNQPSQNGLPQLQQMRSPTAQELANVNVQSNNNQDTRASTKNFQVSTYEPIDPKQPLMIKQSDGTMILNKNNLRPVQGAQEIARSLEAWRARNAEEWIGNSIKDWDSKTPVDAVIGKNIPAQGATEYIPGGQKGIDNIQMTIMGQKNILTDSIIPHETAHTILAEELLKGKPLGTTIPRWADEGTCSTLECFSERSKLNNILVQSLQNEGKFRDTAIPFNKMLSMQNYPDTDEKTLALYAQGTSAAEYLIRKGGGGTEGRRKFMEFVGDAMNNRGSDTAWTGALQKHYGIQNPSDFQTGWNKDVYKRVYEDKSFFQPPLPPSQFPPTNIRSAPQPLTNPQSYAPQSNPIFSSSSVRIATHIQGSSGQPLKLTDGTGTLIGRDRNTGDGIILTAAHTFDNIGQAGVSLEFYGKQGRIPATVINHDYASGRDLALLRVPANTIANIPETRVAPSNYNPRVGDNVLRVGCPGGGAFTPTQCSIVSIDRYVGPSNLQTTKQSVKGESGGGLFDPKIKSLIGVNRRGDTIEDQAIYANIKSIHEYLRANGYGYLIPNFIIILENNFFEVSQNLLTSKSLMIYN